MLLHGAHFEDKMLKHHILIVDFEAHQLAFFSNFQIHRFTPEQL